MKITIDEDICKQYGLEVAELLAILLVKTSTNIPRLFNNMEAKQYIIKDAFEGYLVTQHWNDVSDSIILDSEKANIKDENKEIEDLALELMSIFPAQKKQGTCHYFRGNKKDISLRLKKFFKLYGDSYTKEQILDAARKYVASFNGNYSYMRILKYFIWKDERKTDSEGKGYTEETSDLASYIDNNGEESNNDWTAELR
jgi:hypothetical protein